MVAAIAYHSFSLGINGLLYSLGGLSLGFTIFITPYMLGGMGAGDVKLMAAIGAIFGPAGICTTSIMVILSGGIYGIILFLLNPRYMFSFLKRIWSMIRTFLQTRQLIFIQRDIKEKPIVLRFAIPIAIGSLAYIIMVTSGYDMFPELFGDGFRILSINPH